MTPQPATYYFEQIHGEFHLLAAGSIQSFRSTSQMYQFIDDPHALVIEVTPDNWQSLYDSGAFDHE